MIDGFKTKDLYEIAMLLEENVPVLDKGWQEHSFYFTFSNAEAMDVFMDFKAGMLMLNARRYISKIKEVKGIIGQMRRTNNAPLIEGKGELSQ